MVAAEFRDVHVPVSAGACYPAEGVQEVVFHPVAEEEYVLFCFSYVQGIATMFTGVWLTTMRHDRGPLRPQEHEAPCGASF